MRSLVSASMDSSVLEATTLFSKTTSMSAQSGKAYGLSSVSADSANEMASYNNTSGVLRCEMRVPSYDIVIEYHGPAGPYNTAVENHHNGESVAEPLNHNEYSRVGQLGYGIVTRQSDQSQLSDKAVPKEIERNCETRHEIYTGDFPYRDLLAWNGKCS